MVGTSIFEVSVTVFGLCTSSAWIGFLILRETRVLDDLLRALGRSGATFKPEHLPSKAMSVSRSGILGHPRHHVRLDAAEFSKLT